MSKIKDNVIVMEYTGPWRVKLTYFKQTGKYYSEGEYVSKKLHLFEVWGEVKDMLKAGRRPGLVDGKNEFFVTVDVPEHPHNHPVLIFPEKDDVSETLPTT